MNSANQAQVLCHFKCDDHLKNISNLFNSLHSTDSLVDLTISCQGGSFKAHKFVLSACSPYFKKILNENPCKHPTFIMHGILFEDMKLLLEFMYKGAVSVPEDSINSLVEIATNLEIKGFRFAGDISAKQGDGFPVNSQTAVHDNNLNNDERDPKKPKKKCIYNNKPTSDIKIKSDQEEYVEVEDVDNSIEVEKNKSTLDISINSGRQTRFRGLKRVPVGEVVYSDDYYSDNTRNSTVKKQSVPVATPVKPSDDCFSNIIIKDIRGANGSLCLSVTKTEVTNTPENTIDPDVLSLIPDITISESANKIVDDPQYQKDEHLIKPKTESLEVKVKEENNLNCKNSITPPQKTLDAKPFRCEFCKLGFTRSSHLLRHRRTHTGERPFGCKHCDKAFSRQDKLRIHMMRTHGDVFQPKYVCDFCDKVFERHESLKAHITKHDYEYAPTKYKAPVLLHSSIGIDEQTDTTQTGTQSITQSIIQTVKEFTNSTSSKEVVTPPASIESDNAKSIKRKRGRPRTREIPINKEKRRRGRPRKLSVEGEYTGQENYDLMSLPFGDFSYLTSELPLQLPANTVTIPAVAIPEVIETTPALPPAPSPDNTAASEIPEATEQNTDAKETPPASANELINSIRVIGECTISPLN